MEADVILKVGIALEFSSKERKLGCLKLTKLEKTPTRTAELGKRDDFCQGSAVAEALAYSPL